MIRKVKNKFQKHMDDVLALKTEPHSIAAGFALGTLLAILPTFGFGIFIGLLIILFWKDVSKIAMFVAFAVWNPLVLALLVPIEYSIGNMLFPPEYATQFSIDMVNHLFFYTGRLFAGSIVLALVMSLIFYSIIFFVVRIIRAKEKVSITLK